MSQSKKITQTPEIDDVTWKIWLNKNAAQDKFRAARRLRVLSVVSLVLTVGALLWKFQG
jgi:hypothetical protein